MRAERTPALLMLFALANVANAAPVPPAAPPAECPRPEVLCVGAGAEYERIQPAVDAVQPGQTVLVLDGEYAGFRVRNGGTPEAPISIVAAGEAARITSAEPGSGDGIYIEDSSFLLLEGFVVEGAPAYGIGAHDALPDRPMRGLVVRNNVVRRSASTNIYLSQVADSIVEGNVAIGSLDSHGIYLANAGSDNTVLRGNNCYGNAVNGIHFNGDQADTGDGLQWLLTVEGNVIHGNGANGLNMDGVQYTTVRNNLVFDNGRHGLRAYAIDGADGPRLMTVVNNTFAGNGGWSIKFTQDGGRHTVFNNVLMSRSGSLAVASRELVADRNVALDAFSVDGERTVLRLAQWQAAGFGSNTRLAEPDQVFVAPGDSDYRLGSGSPALDAGVFILNGQLAPTIDLIGRERPSGGAYDIGAFEGS